LKKNSKRLMIINYALDYIPIIATVLLATFATLKAIQSPLPVSEVLQWVLVVLGLLATTQLIDRFRVIRSLDLKIDKLSESVNKGDGAKTFFIHHIPNLRERLLDAKSISINGITLSRTTDALWDVFKQQISGGGTVRLLLVDPDHSALEFAALRFQKHQDSVRLRREVKHALDNLESLAELDKNLFQVRLLPFPPAFGIWAIDVGSPKAEIWVELYSFRDLPEPTFQLLPDRDGEWFYFFQKQFDQMWAIGKPWQPLGIEKVTPLS